MSDPRTEFAWLIEDGPQLSRYPDEGSYEPPIYYAAEQARANYPSWTKDAYAAMRFASKAEAAAFMESQRDGDRPMPGAPVEHGFAIGLADPEPIANETESGYARRRELVARARLTVRAPHRRAYNPGPDCSVCGMKRINVVHAMTPEDRPEGEEYHATFTHHEFVPSWTTDLAWIVASSKIPAGL